MHSYLHHPRRSTWMPLWPQVLTSLIKNHIRIIAQIRFYNTYQQYLQCKEVLIVRYLLQVFASNQYAIKWRVRVSSVMPILKHIILRTLTRYDCVPYRYISLQICFYYLHWFFTFNTSLYQLCQSLVIIECHILTLYHNCITLTHFIVCIMLYVLFVFYVQRWRTLRFGAI